MGMLMNHNPFFIISGAMKSGTTWLHESLGQLPEIYIPREEVHLFDCKDPTVHPEFHKLNKSGLQLADERYLLKKEIFSPIGSSVKVGLDSSTLFHSKISFSKLAQRMPDTRFVVLLRDPVMRAYSHYWHLVRTGRARFCFEKELLYGKQEILHRSIYVDQVNRFKLALKEKVYFVCYEQMFADPEKVLSELLLFLDLPPSSLGLLLSQLKKQSNPGRYPRFMPGWLLGSRLLSGLERGRYAKEIEGEKISLLNRSKYIGYVFKLYMMALLAGGVVRKKPKMRLETRNSLCCFFKEANEGLDDLLGNSFSRWWYH